MKHGDWGLRTWKMSSGPKNFGEHFEIKMSITPVPDKKIIHHAMVAAKFQFEDIMFSNNFTLHTAILLMLHGNILYLWI